MPQSLRIAPKQVGVNVVAVRRDQGNYLWHCQRRFSSVLHLYHPSILSGGRSPQSIES